MPSPYAIARNQAGLGLPLAISVLLLLAVVAAGVTQWMGAAHEDVAAEVTSQRALAAARSGLEWGRVQVRDRVEESKTPPCFPGRPLKTNPLQLNKGNGCAVGMKCESVNVSAPGGSTTGSTTIFALEAVGTCPFRGSISAERTLRMRVRP